MFFLSHSSFSRAGRGGRHKKYGRTARSAREYSTPDDRTSTATAGSPERRSKLPEVPLENDVPYTCPACFEESFLAFDPSGGRRQRFVEDCPVCCRPIDFEVAVDRDGDTIVERAEPAE